MRAVVVAFGRGFLSQFKARMLLLTLVPLVLAAVVWGVLLRFGLQSLADAIQRYLTENNGFAVSTHWLSILGLGALKGIIVPVLAMWLFLPLMVITALLFVGFIAMPAIVEHIGGLHHPDLERRRGGSYAGLIWTSICSHLIFVALWVVTTPLCAFPVIGFAVQPLLWGWLAYRVIAYDVLRSYADAEELRELLRRHRWQLLAIGTVTGLLGVVPSLLWFGGLLSFLLFPFIAVLAMCLYVFVFTFSGLWFTHFGLTAVRELRGVGVAPPVAA
jgi:hypothetical protein